MIDRDFLSVTDIPNKEKMTEFMLYLVANGYLQKIPPVKNCLVLYFDQNTLKHSGILEKDGDSDQNKIIRSKWDEIGKVCTHPLWNIPLEYGTSVKYYKPLSFENLSKYFKEFSILEKER